MENSVTDDRMILIGMFDSPFVRRVAVSLLLLGLPFEHRDWSVGKDFDRIREFNPLGRVPTVVCPDGEVLLESAAILDCLDEGVGAERALLPRSGVERRQALRLMGLASGAAEKGVLQVYERVFRPEDKRHPAWVKRCSTQMHAALGALELHAAGRGGEWLVGSRLTQADITVACVFGFLWDALSLGQTAPDYPTLAGVSARCEALPAFQAAKAPFFTP